MRENWYALLIATQISVKTVEQAFNLLRRGKRQIKDIPIKEVLKLRKNGYKMRELAERYNISQNTLYTKIRAYKKEAKNEHICIDWIYRIMQE